MYMVNHKCNNCGGNLKLNRITGLYKCTSCGSEFSIEKENIQSERVFLNAGEEFLSLKEYDKAFESFDMACKLTPSNAMCWLGMIKSVTKQFSELKAENFKTIEKYMRNVEKCLTEDERKSISDDLMKYKSLKDKYLQSEKERKISEKFSDFLKYSIVVVFCIIVILNFVFFTKSNSEYVWKIVGFVLLLIIDIVIFKVVSLLANLFKPKKKLHYWLIGIIFTLVLVLLFSLDILFAKTI